ncbi:hypothetical protein BJ912DRAFT_982243 [Pholiota molesta]|nr:hypothetical protein BJ912DRAFT_982243 [Pholiota molesta]
MRLRPSHLPLLTYAFAFAAHHTIKQTKPPSTPPGWRCARPHGSTAWPAENGRHGTKCEGRQGKRSMVLRYGLW